MRAIVTALSPRQGQVAELVAEGLTSEEIARMCPSCPRMTSPPPKVEALEVAVGGVPHPPEVTI